MTEHCAIYGRVAAPLDPTALGQAGVELTVATPADATFQKQVSGFLLWLGPRAGRDALAAVARTKQVLALTSQQGFAPGTLTRIAERVHGLRFERQQLLDAAGNVVLAPDGRSDPAAKIWVSASALARKQRSEERLLSLGARLPREVPPFEGNEEALFREPAEVARRCFALFAVALVSEGLPGAEALSQLTAAGLEGSLSRRERAFLSGGSAADAVQFGWMYECLWPLLWALGKVEVLHTPSAACDVPRAAQRMTAGTAKEFVESARLRPSAELLDEADFHLRANAASPPGFDAGVLYERCRAFAWLTRQLQAEWDQVRVE
jgi:hypothetical protein